MSAGILTEIGEFVRAYTDGEYFFRSFRAFFIRFLAFFFSFEQAAEAHTKMLTGKGLFGKILMKPEGA